MTTQRDVFFNTIKELRKSDDRIIILSVDMGAASLNDIKGEDWCIYTGPNEQLAITMATGLAIKGFKPYIYLISSFVTRAFEQIHLACSMNLPFTIVGVGAGLSYDTAGLTHHAINDLNALRCIPNMTTCNISSLEMAEYYAKESLNSNIPLYIRLDKKSNNFHKVISDYGWQIIKYGLNKNLIITTGVITDYVYHNTNLYDTIEIFQFPCNEESLIKFFNNVHYENIISIEENYKIGGLGDYLLSLGLKVKKVGFSDFCSAKSREEYLKFLLGELNEFE